jgi:Domain of unknown function (DUF6916)
VRLVEITFAVLAERVGDTVVVRTDPEVELTLSRVDADAEGTGGAVVFRGDNAWVLPEDTYRLVHPELGEFDLVLVPVGRDADGFEYQTELA